jgi:hypothetical protein
VGMWLSSSCARVPLCLRLFDPRIPEERFTKASLVVAEQSLLKKIGKGGIREARSIGRMQLD